MWERVREGAKSTVRRGRGGEGASEYFRRRALHPCVVVLGATAVP